jgi:hypothetical protein
MRFMGSRRFERRRGSWDREPVGQRAWGRVTRYAERRTLAMYDVAAARSDAMQRRAGADRRGTRKRALPAVAAGLAGLAGMFTLVSQNVLAVNFTTTDTKFKLYSNYLQGESAAGFLAQNKGSSTSSQVGVAELGIKSAKLDGLCAIATDKVPILNTPYSLIIRAGDSVQGTGFSGSALPTGVQTQPETGNDPGTTPGDLTGTSLANAINATNLFVNTNNLSGFGNLISGLNLGQSADTVSTTAGFQPTGQDAGQWPTGQNPPQAGNFGLTATHLNVAGLSGDTYGINLQGNITLPNLKISVVPGTADQSACPTS